MMSYQDAFETLLTEDLDRSDNDLHELDVLWEVVRYDIVGVDVYALDAAQRALDLLGRFAPHTPVPLTLIEMVSNHNQQTTDEHSWMWEALLDVLATYEVVQLNEPAWGLLTIPINTATWAQSWSARARRDDILPPLPPEAVVRQHLIDCATALLNEALREDDTLAVLDVLPHAEYWLRRHSHELAARQQRMLITLVQQARTHLRNEHASASSAMLSY
jgi:hypothetical protein